MKKKNRKEREDLRRARERGAPWHEDLHPDTKRVALAILAFTAAALLCLSYIGKGGAAGTAIFKILDYLFGGGYFFAPLAFILIGFSVLVGRKQKVGIATFLGGLLFLLSSLSALHVLFGEKAGGFVGALLGGGLLNLFDFTASIVIAVALFSISLLLTLNIPLKRTLEEKGKSAPDVVEVITSNNEPKSKESMLKNFNTALRSAFEKRGDLLQPSTETTDEHTVSTIAATTAAVKEAPLIEIRKIAKKFNYKKPPLDLLQGDRGTPSSGDIKANANIIKRTLENFGVEVEMGEVSIGPTVTQYTLKPAEGVKLSRITALHNDLSLALAAHPIRIEAPIPGKSLVGIEVPNRSIALVGLRALLDNKLYQEATSPLMFALGRDVTGAPVYADLARMPHLLISGATGSGKSVSAHSIVTSFLYRNPPELLRFIIIDPKRVELSVYNSIPHLLTPVITDPKKTVQALRWATKEMDRRYDLLFKHHVRDIASFNLHTIKGGEEEILPYIVIMIDELADLMAMFPREVEASIIRLAQMARAIGIHLVVATQRPSVEVITGLIKANITSRIAFQVASQIDSRTILDMAGAEKLLGNGDMLFIAGDTAKPRRIQGGFVSEQEIKKVVEFLARDVEITDYDESITQTKADDIDLGLGDDEDGGDDPLYEEAKNLVVQADKASASYLQRRLRVGYARAARLLDLLESHGVIGPGEGAKPREILMRSAESSEENEK